jgi:hypothetical protein
MFSVLDGTKSMCTSITMTMNNSGSDRPSESHTALGDSVILVKNLFDVVQQRFPNVRLWQAAGRVRQQRRGPTEDYLT